MPRTSPAMTLGYRHLGIDTWASTLGHRRGHRHSGSDTGASTLGHRHWGIDTGASTLGHRTVSPHCSPERRNGMRILHVMASRANGGAETYCADMLQSLKAAGVDQVAVIP